MILALHGLTTKYCNIVTDIKIAKETGYKTLEIYVPKVLRYLEQGYDIDELRDMLKANSLLYLFLWIR